MENKRELLYEVQGLKKYFSVKKGVAKAVDDVSFSIIRGETLSLVGESGCGKTTCGRTLLGVYPKTGGRIIYKGKELSDLKGKARLEFQKNNQMIFQDPYSCLDPRMTIETIIEEGMRIHNHMSREEYRLKTKNLLLKVGLTEEFASRFPHELSGGQRQRVGIARALAMDPEFIVCDEPIAALDVSIQAQVINLMIRLQRDMGLTYLFISHDLSMVRHISDRIAVMYLGSIMELAPSAPLYENPLHPYTQALFSAIPKAEARAGWSQKRIRLTGEIPTPISPPPGCKFSSRCPNAQELCRQQAPVLEDMGDGHFVACHYTDSKKALAEGRKQPISV